MKYYQKSLWDIRFPKKLPEKLTLKIDQLLLFIKCHFMTLLW